MLLKITNSIFRPNFATYETNVKELKDNFWKTWPIGLAIFDQQFGVYPSNAVFYKIKKSIFQPNYARYEKMLRSRIDHLKKIYKFDFDHFLEKRTIFIYFDHFLIKRTVFVLIMKNVIKNHKFNFPDKLWHTKKNVRNKIICFKKIYEFYFDYFLIKCTSFCFHRNKYYFNFPDKQCKIRKNVKKVKLFIKKTIILIMIIFW